MCGKVGVQCVLFVRRCVAPCGVYMSTIVYWKVRFYVGGKQKTSFCQISLHKAIHKLSNRSKKIFSIQILAHTDIPVGQYLESV